MSLKMPNAKQAARAAAALEILKAAQQLLTAKGYAGTSMSDIATASGLSVGSLYNYFSDKEDLFRSLFAQVRQGLVELTDVVIQSPLTFSQKLERLTHEILSFYDINRAALQLILHNELPSAPGLAGRRPRPFFYDFFEKLEPLMEQGVREGVLDERFAGTLGGIYTAQLRAVFLRRLEDGRAFAGAAEDVLHIFFHGVQPLRA